MDSSRPALKGFIPQDFEYSNSATISPKKTNRFEKFINCCAFLVLSPFWALFSIVAEVTAIPFQLTLNTLKRCTNNGFTLGFCIIISPVIFVGFCIFTTAFTPISFMMKIYACIKAEDFSEGMKCLVYPTTHPVYGNYLKPAQTVKLGKTLFISAAETSTTYDPPKMSFGRDEISSLDWDYEKDQVGDYFVNKK